MYYSNCLPKIGISQNLQRWGLSWWQLGCYSSQYCHKLTWLSHPFSSFLVTALPNALCSAKAGNLVYVEDHSLSKVHWLTTSVPAKSRRNDCLMYWIKRSRHGQQGRSEELTTVETVLHYPAWLACPSRSRLSLSWRCGASFFDMCSDWIASASATVWSAWIDCRWLPALDDGTYAMEA